MNTYDKIKLLGRGSFGEAWIVENNKIKYVMKLLRTDRVNLSSFHKEIETLNKISIGCKQNSSSFCLIESFIEYPKTETDIPNYVIITNYLENAKELTEFMYTLDVHSILFIMQRLLEQLTTFHNNNITHSDIKPQNIIIQFKDTFVKNVLFIDFGLACIQDTCKYSGTVSYMAPEALRNLQKETTIENIKKTDIWSLGVVFYRLLNKTFPYKSYDDYLYNKKSELSELSDNNNNNSDNNSELSENTPKDIIKGNQIFRLVGFYEKHVIKSNYYNEELSQETNDKLNFIVESMLILDSSKRITINEINTIFPNILIKNNFLSSNKIFFNEFDDSEYTE
jgi:serine/threonine protein kinase